METNTHLQDLRRNMIQARNAYLQAVEENFSDSVAELFEEHSELETFAWQQYTPYFNDDQPAHFEVGRWPISINDIDMEDPGVDTHLAAVICDFLSIYTEDALELLFGDHCQIHAVRGGDFQVTQYNNHD